MFIFIIILIKRNRIIQKMQKLENKNLNRLRYASQKSYSIEVFQVNFKIFFISNISNFLSSAIQRVEEV
jgi:hypothetical protein